MNVRYFEFSEGSSNKFWEVRTEGNVVFTRYGKIGADGQTTVKDEGDPVRAEKLAARLIDQKTRKGYLEKKAQKASRQAVQKPEGKAVHVPQRQLTELYLRSQFSDDADEKKRARALLLEAASPGLAALLKTKANVNSEGRLKKFIDANCNASTGLDPIAFARGVVSLESSKGADGISVGLTWLLAHGDREAKIHALKASTLGGTYLELAGYKEIPDELFELRELEELQICQGKVKVIHERIGQLERLTKLVLEGNQIAALPSSLGSLKNLESLDLSDNLLTAVPEAVGKLGRLTSLNLRRNAITTVPETLGALKHLTYLGLSNNKLTTLPDFVAGLPRLTELGLTGNPVGKDVEAVKAWKKALKLKCKIYLGDVAL